MTNMNNNALQDDVVNNDYDKDKRIQSIARRLMEWEKTVQPYEFYLSFGTMNEESVLEYYRSQMYNENELKTKLELIDGYLDNPYLEESVNAETHALLNLVSEVLSYQRENRARAYLMSDGAEEYQNPMNFDDYAKVHIGQDETKTHYFEFTDNTIICHKPCLEDNSYSTESFLMEHGFFANEWLNHDLEYAQYEAALPHKLDLLEAKLRINDYLKSEFGTEDDMTDLSNIPLAYSTDGNHTEIQVSADLEKYRIVYQIDNYVYKVDQCRSLRHMNDTCLKMLNFGWLIGVVDNDDVQDFIYQQNLKHGIEPYRYYLTKRPPAPGTIPANVKPVNVVSFDQKQSVENGKVSAWGYVEYNYPLDEKDIKNYELKYIEKYKVPTIKVEYSMDPHFKKDSTYTVLEFETAMLIANRECIEQRQMLVDKYGSKENVIEQGTIEEKRLMKRNLKVQYTIYEPDGNENTIIQGIGTQEIGFIETLSKLGLQDLSERLNHSVTDQDNVEPDGINLENNIGIIV